MKEGETDEDQADERLLIDKVLITPSLACGCHTQTIQSPT